MKMTLNTTTKNNTTTTRQQQYQYQQQQSDNVDVTMYNNYYEDRKNRWDNEMKPMIVSIVLPLLVQQPYYNDSNSIPNGSTTARSVITTATEDSKDATTTATTITNTISDHGFLLDIFQAMYMGGIKDPDLLCSVAYLVRYMLVPPNTSSSSYSPEYYSSSSSVQSLSSSTSGSGLCPYQYNATTTQSNDDDDRSCELDPTTTTTEAKITSTTKEKITDTSVKPMSYSKSNGYYYMDLPTYLDAIHCIGKYLMSEQTIKWSVGTDQPRQQDQQQQSTIDDQEQYHVPLRKKQKLLVLYGLLAATTSNDLFHQFCCYRNTVDPTTVVCHHLETSSETNSSDDNIVEENNDGFSMTNLLENVLHFCTNEPTTTPVTVVANENTTKSVPSVLLSRSISTTTTPVNETKTIIALDQKRSNWEEYLLPQQKCCVDDTTTRSDANKHNNNESTGSRKESWIQNERALLVLWELRAVCCNYRIKQLQRQQERSAAMVPKVTTSGMAPVKGTYTKSSPESTMKKPRSLFSIKSHHRSKIEANDNNNPTTPKVTVTHLDQTTTGQVFFAEPTTNVITNTELEFILNKIRALYGMLDFTTLISMAHIVRAIRISTTATNIHDYPTVTPTASSNDERDYYQQTFGSTNTYNESVLNVASFLEDPNQLRDPKLACLNIFFIASPNRIPRLQKSITDSDQVTSDMDLEILQDALLFCTDTSPQTRHVRNWEHYLIGNDAILLLLWEIRAICLNLSLQRRRSNKKGNKKSVLLPAVVACNKASEYVTSGAVTIERSIATTTNLITSSIDAAGDYIVRNTIPSDHISTNDTCTATLLTLSCTGSVKEASKQTRTVTASAITGMKHVSRSSLRAIADTMKLSPDKSSTTATGEISDGAEESDAETQESIVASAGQLGLATLGAAVIVGDAISDSATKIVQHTTYTAADIASHKYGPSVGQIIRDVADTTGNVLDTMKHITFLIAPVYGHGQGVAKMVVKDTGRTHLTSTLYISNDASPTSILSTPQSLSSLVDDVSAQMHSTDEWMKNGGEPPSPTKILPRQIQYQQESESISSKMSVASSALSDLLPDLSASNKSDHMIRDRVLKPENRSLLDSAYCTDKSYSTQKRLRNHEKSCLSIESTDDETATDSYFEGDDPELVLEVKFIPTSS